MEKVSFLVSIIQRQFNHKLLMWILLLSISKITLFAFAFDGRDVQSLKSNSSQSSYLGFYDNSEGSPLVALIDSAKTSIDIEIYEMKDHQVLSALKRAIHRRVAIRIVQEPHPLGGCAIFKSGDLNEESLCGELRNFVRTVINSGNQYVAYNKNQLCRDHTTSCFQHGKIVIIDRIKALISSGNFNNTNLCDLAENPNVCNRDYSFVTNDAEILNTLEGIFEADLAGVEYNFSSFFKNKISDKLTVSPVSMPSILQFIQSATEIIQIQNQYLNEPRLNAALIEAAKRGVQVEVMVSSECSFGRPSDSKRRNIERIYSEFDRAGIASRFFTGQMRIHGKPGYLHAKAIVIDHKRAWVGSMNGSTPAAENNREFGIFFDDPRSVDQLSQIMKNDQINIGSETWQESINCVKDEG